MTYTGLTPPANAKGLVVGIGVNNDDPITATYGGVAMTLVCEDSQKVTRIYELLDLSGVSSDDLVITKVWHNHTGVEAVWLIATQEVYRVDEAADYLGSTNNNDVTLDPGSVATSAAYVIGTAGRSGGVPIASLSPHAGQTQLSEVDIPASPGPSMGASYKTGVTASATYGYTASGAFAGIGVAAVLYAMADVTLTPVVVTLEVEVPSGVGFHAIGDANYAPTPSYLEVVVPAGVGVNSTGPMQVALVGEDREIHRHTTGGTEGQVLTFHEDTEPTWEDGGAGSEHPDVGDHETMGLATQASLDAHVDDVSDAHDASSISVEDIAGNFTGTDVEAVLAELADIVVGADITSLLVDLSVSGARTVDRADAATHDLTLTGDSTLTPDHSTLVPGEAIDLRVIVRQDGTGGWGLDWGGTIAWVGGSEPTMPTAPDDAMTVGLLSVDDAVTWFGYVTETSGSVPSDTVEDETGWGVLPDAGVSTEYSRGDHTHGTPDMPSPGGGGSVGAILLESGHAVPFTFDEILQESDGSDFLYASE